MTHKVTCKHCGRYLFKAKGTTIIEQFPCPNSKCRAKLNIKIIDMDSTDEQRRYKFTTAELPPKLHKLSPADIIPVPALSISPSPECLSPAKSTNRHNNL